MDVNKIYLNHLFIYYILLIHLIHLILKPLKLSLISSSSLLASSQYARLSQFIIFPVLFLRYLHSNRLYFMICSHPGVLMNYSYWYFQTVNHFCNSKMKLKTATAYQPFVSVHFSSALLRIELIFYESSVNPMQGKTNITKKNLII